MTAWKRWTASPAKSEGARARTSPLSNSVSSVLAEVTPKPIWKFLKSQGPSYWFLLAYFFLEYVRPQDIWPALAAVPWGQMVLIACTGALLFERGRRLRFATPVSVLLAVFTFLLALSSFLSYYPDRAIDGWTVYANWILVFFLTINIVDTKEKLYVFLLFFLLWSFKMSQHAARTWAGAGFAFRDWGVVGIGGWFHDSGEFGIQMVIFFSLATYMLASFWERWNWLKRVLFAVLPLTAVIAVVGSSSRGALLGLAAVVGFMILQTRRSKAVLAAAAVGLLVLLLLPQEQIQRFGQAGEDRTSQARLRLWEDGLEMMNRHPALGIGYDNWLPYYEEHYGNDLVPHNIFIEAGAELGYTGLVVFLLLVGGTFRLNWRVRRMSRFLPDGGGFLRNMALGMDAALIGYLVCGAFVTVLYYPFFWINLSMSASLFLISRSRYRELGRRQRDQRQPRWRRGRATRAARR